ncbi:hypothetical protein J1N35_045631 [Gossypium stocksii]|uniref:CCHC-type domain-containing protein n=1 Tax=Gossypium stocksii TaxID=47602 RepID=A0A9D3ZHD5_9ROSI|nr:hypothetical protein J1N35_045631 [Gossypium stocksii]
MPVEKVNREAMYRVFKSIWYKKEEVNFVAMKEGVILVKFGDVEDRKRILNLSPWLFDKCLFAMLSYVKEKEMDSYAFNLSPFWVRIFSIPFEYMDRSVVMDVGSAIREVIAIDWCDRDGRWTEYIRLRVIINISKPLRRVVQFVNREGVTSVCAIKYERLPTFCYNCGLINHSTQKCEKSVIQSNSNEISYQYGNRLRASTEIANQERRNWRNGIEVREAKSRIISVRKEKTQGNTELNDWGTVGEDWIVGGDFNAILNDVEKEGGRRKARSQINEFKDLVDELALVDISLIKDGLPGLIVGMGIP